MDANLQVLELVPDAVVVFSPESGRVLEVNDQACALYGYTPEQFAGSGLRFDQLWADAEAARAALAGLQAGARIGGLETEHRTREGGRLWVQVHAGGIQLRGERAILSVHRDVTAQREAERALKDSQQFWMQVGEAVMAMWENSPDGMRITDSQGRVLRVNEAYCRIVGMTREVCEGELFTLAYPEENAAPRLEAYRRRFAERTIEARFGRKVKTASGAETWVEVSSTWLESGAEPLLLSVFRDVTEQKKTDEALRTLSRAVEQCPASIVVTDLHGTIVYVNPAFSEVTGYSSTEAVGQNPRILKTDAAGPETYRGLWETITGGRTWAGEFRNRKKDGTYFWERARIAPVRDAEGAITHYVAVKEDITEWKAAQAELERAREAADTAARAKSDFLASMSHEIRTPMNGIAGTTDLLADTALTGEQRDYVTTIRSCSDSLLTLVNDILDSSKIEAGKLELERVSFDLRHALEEILDLTAYRAQEKGLELLLRYPDNVPRQVFGDPSRIRQIVLNLVSNAVKFTHSGYAMVEASYEPAASDGGLLRIAVEDTGIGIAAGKLEYIFDQFTQADSSMTRKYGGTGLGLAISRKLAQLMGGSLTAESELGRGARFTCAIPVEPDHVAAALSATLPPAPLHLRRVLIASENRVSAELVAEICRGWNMRADVAIGLQTAPEIVVQAASDRDPYHDVIADFPPGCGDCEQARSILDRMAGAGVETVVGMVPLAVRHTLSGRCPTPSGSPVVYLAKPLRRAALSAVLVDRAGAPPEDRAAEPLQETAISAGTPQHYPAVPGDRRVLLVEDNAVNQKLATAMLQKMGAKVELAVNGIEAVRMASACEFDLILMDCQMPEMDGYAAAVEMRRMQQDSHRVPIVALTASARPEERKRCLQAGMDDCLSKPVRLDALRMALETWAVKRPTEPEVLSD